MSLRSISVERNTSILNHIDSYILQSLIRSCRRILQKASCFRIPIVRMGNGLTGRRANMTESYVDTPKKYSLSLQPLPCFPFEMLIDVFNISMRLRFWHNIRHTVVALVTCCTVMLLYCRGTKEATIEPWTTTSSSDTLHLDSTGVHQAQCSS